jgi:TolB-like protein/thioredoxin-like negative regulator of GroEL
MGNGIPENTPQPAEQPASERLDSWKEIAAYLKREVRTVRRWEKTEKLPVHRHLHKKRGTVYAYKPELDRWWNNGRARLEQQEQMLAAARPRRRWIWAMGLVALPAALALLLALNLGGLRDRLLGRPLPGEITSIAVLPLDNLSGDPEQEFFTDGMTEALLTELGKIGALRVISRQSVMQYKDSEKPLPEIARELNVDAAIEGSAVREGDRVRITIQLIQASPEQHLWAESYERDFTSALALQGEMARAIARQVRATVTPEEETRLASARLVDAGAYEAYLKGRYIFWNEEHREESIRFFEEAIERDPAYAAAYSALAQSYAATGLDRVAPAEEAFEKARVTAHKALELDDRLATAHTSLGYVKLWWDWDWPGAESAFKQGVEYEPDNVEALFGYMFYLLNARRFEEAIAVGENLLALDPFTPDHNIWLGAAYNGAGQHGRAATHYERIVKEANQTPNIPAGIWNLLLASAYARNSEYEKALAEMEKIASSPLANSRPFIAGLGWIYAVAGKREEAIEQLEKLKRLPGEEWEHGMAVARIYTALGQPDEAFEWLGRAYEKHYLWLVRLDAMVEFAPLRGDPRYEELARKIGFPRYAERRDLESQKGN